MSVSTTTYTVVNGVILFQEKDGVVHDFVPDPLGSVIMVMDADDNIVYEAEYDPYGNVQSETGTNPSSLGYVGTLGYIKDSATSMYVRARYLLNNLGRWLTKDPLWPYQKGYVYSGANPICQTDRSGADDVEEPPIPGGKPAPWPPKPPYRCNTGYSSISRKFTGKKQGPFPIDPGSVSISIGFKDVGVGIGPTCKCAYTKYQARWQVKRAYAYCPIIGMMPGVCATDPDFYPVYGEPRLRMLPTRNCVGNIRHTFCSCYGKTFTVDVSYEPYKESGC